MSRPQPVTVATTPAYVFAVSAGRQAEDGVVVVNSLAVPVRMVDDLRNINPVVHAVRDAVLSKKNADTGCGRAHGAVGGGEHVGRGDQGSSTPGGAAVPADQPHLPGVFVFLGLLTTDNTTIGSTA